MAKNALIAGMRSVIVRPRVLPAIVNIVAVILFIFVVAFLRGFKPEAAGFDAKGPWLLLYHFCRLALGLYITVFCYSAGYRAIELFQVGPRELFGTRRTFIVCFFVGASFYGIAFSVLGLLGLINLASAFALTLPVLLLSYDPIKAIVPQRTEDKSLRLPLDAYATPFFARVLIFIGIGAAILFLLTAVLFLAVYDPNIWEHYLHYYRAVLASGSTQPNEVWHHFYASKGGGLILLTNVLSDFFGAQIVSACFIAVAGLIILDLLLEYCKSLSWSLFGAALFFIFVYGNGASGETFKHHAVILGYASFAFWGSVQLQHATARQFRALMAALVVSLFYFGFYQPVATALFPLAFLLLALISRLFHEKTYWQALLILACAVSAGTALDIALNWTLTGLPEVTPMRWTWAIADQAKAKEVFGMGGIDFFLAVNNNLSKQYDWSLNRMWQILRYPLPTAALLLSLLGALVLLMQHRASQTVPDSDKFVARVAVFVLPLTVFAQAVQTAAVDRMALYSIVFTTLAIVVIWKRVLEICIDQKFWQMATAIIVMCGMAVAFVQATRKLGRQTPVIAQFSIGAMSLKEAFHRIETRLHTSTTGINVAAMSEFRKTIPPGQRIVRLAFDAGFSYSLPGEGIVSEPTYALIRDPRRMLAEKPDEVAAYLRDRNIGYFTLNLKSMLFTSIAFTSLFDPREMRKYFSIAYEDRDFYILKWRQSDEETPLHDDMLTLFELKRTGILHYPFTEEFANLVAYGTQMVDSISSFERARDAFVKDLERALSDEILPRISLDTSKTVLRRIVDAAKKGEVNRAEPAKLLVTRWARDNARIVERVSERELKSRLLVVFRDALYKQYVAEFGPELASLFRTCDERGTFAMNPAIASCF